MTADLAVLGLEIDSRPAVTASEALDNLAQSSASAEGASQAMLAAMDRLTGALNTNTGAIRTAGAAYRELGGQVTTTGTNLDQFVTRGERVIGAVNDQARAVRGAADAWKALDQAGRSAVQNYDRNARASQALGSLSSTGGVPVAPPRPSGSGGEGEASQRFRDMLMRDVLFNVKDFGEQVLAGSSPIRAGLQQGPQIAALMSMGGFGITDVLTSLSSKATAAAGAIGVLGAATGGFAVAVGLAVAAQQSYSATQVQLAQNLSGVGRASGTTAQQINAIAAASASAGGVSVRQAREMAGAFAATGQIGAEMYSGLIRTTKDYAATTGQDLATAQQEVARAFADPAKGAEMLNARLGFLNDTSLTTVQRLSAQGDRLGAQRALFDAYAGSLTKATELTSGWGHISETVGTTVSNFWDRIGRAADKALTGGSLDERLAKARQRLADAEAAEQSGNPFYSTRHTEGLRAGVSALQAQVDQRERQSQQARANLNSIDIGNLPRSIDPTSEALREAEDRAQKLRRAISDPITFGLTPATLAATEAAMERIARQAMSMRQDIEKFGDAGTAAMVRAAELENRTATMAPAGREAAQRQEAYQNALRAKGLDPNATRADVLARYNGQLANDNLDARDARAIANARDEALKAVTERENLQKVRDLGNDTTRQQSYRQTSRYSTNIRDVPEQYRGTVYEAAISQGLEPDFLASVFRRESRFQPDIISGRIVSPAGAIGPFQFMPSTAAGMGVDPLDFTSSAFGAARMLRERLNARNGNEALALGDWNWGLGNVNRVGGDVTRFPAETRGFIAEVLQQRPQAADMVAAERERQTSLRQEAEALRLAKEANGQDAEGLRARTDAQQAIIREQGRGVEVSREYAATLSAEAAARARIVTEQRVLQFSTDNAFELRQLGRSADEQAAYARARQVVGDDTSRDAQSVAQQAFRTNELKDARTTFQDTTSTFITTLLRSGSAAQAATSGLQMLEEKLLRWSIDQLGAGLFGGSGSSSGGLGGLLGSLFSGSRGLPTMAQGGMGPDLPAAASSGGFLSSLAGLFGFADGGPVFGPGGSREDRVLARLSPGEFVVSAAAASRNLGLLHAINSGGMRGYADGGLVGQGAYPMPPSAASSPAAGQTAGPTFIAHITTQSTGDDAQDQRNAQANAQAFRQEFDRMWTARTQNEMRPGGMLHAAGARRAS